MTDGGNRMPITRAGCFPGQAILILGLGRSGTSYFAGFLRANGVFLGTDFGQGDNLNPRGFLEHRPVVRFHRRLLAKTQPGGADIPLLASVTVPALTAQEEEEGAQILESLARPGLWGWKDPRTLLFIDFWLKLLPDAKLIIPIRHPVEVYYSYLRRLRRFQLINPSVFFPTYARQSERLMEVARLHAPRVYVLDAQSAYRRPELLWTQLSAFLEIDQRVPASYPMFHENEFTRLPLTERTCKVFAKQFPEAAAAFNNLNEMARIQFKPDPESSRADTVFAAFAAVWSLWRTIRARTVLVRTLIADGGKRLRDLR